MVSAARLSVARRDLRDAESWAAPDLIPSPIQAPIQAVSLLTQGGDSRIEPDEVTGLNRYGCGVQPDPDVAPFGSSTASTPSVAGFAAAERLAGRLAEDARRDPRPVVYRQELDRIRHKLNAALGLTDMAGQQTILSPSGTDLHRIALQITCAGAAAPPLVVLPEPHETGSGVVAALGGQLGPAAALRAVAASGSLSGALAAPQIMIAATRAADGRLRPAHEVDEDVSVIVAAAAKRGRRVLLVMMDVSKTGVISPSIACAQDLKTRFPDQVDVMVDACQLRLAPTTLAAYLAQDFMVAITGSKFMTGPAFSAALLLPAGYAERLERHGAPRALATLCAQGEWPAGLAGAADLPERANFGLLLRWEAALEEMRRFAALPPTAVHAFFADFAAAVGEHLAEDDSFEAAPMRPLERTGLGAAPAWDRVQTIFPFMLRTADRFLTPLETIGVQRLLGVDLGRWAGWDTAGRRVQIGQPVACGLRGEAPLSALRLCMSARLASDALGTCGRGPAAVIGDALQALDKTAWLARRIADA